MLNYSYDKYIFNYVYNTVVLGLMTCKSDDQALEYLDRQLALAFKVSDEEIQMITYDAIEVAVDTYIKAYN